MPPRPPADFAALALDTVPAPRRAWFRLCSARHRSPLHFSREGLYRFDSPAAKWGVCYLADDIITGVMEVCADRIRKRRLDFEELDDLRVWQVTVLPDLNLLRLTGPALAKIRATLQCFVSRYALSQEWARAFMTHPADLDGVVYLGRQSGLPCLALFGDSVPAKGRWHQRETRSRCLGKLTEWDGFYPLLVRTGARVWNLPSRPPARPWAA